MKKIGIYGEPGIGCHIDENGNKVYSKDTQNEFKLEQLKGDINANGEFKFEPSFKILFNAVKQHSLENTTWVATKLKKIREEVWETPGLSLESCVACMGDGYFRRLADPQKMLPHSKNKIHVFIVVGENAPCGKGSLLNEYRGKSIYFENFNPFLGRDKKELEEELKLNHQRKYEEWHVEPTYKTIIIETKPEYVNRIKAEFFIRNVHLQYDDEFIVNVVNFERGW